MPVVIASERVNLVDELEAYRQQRPPGADGALASFIGSMRDFNAGAEITGMVLEHYPAMTQQYLQQLCANIIDQWRLNDALIIHRVGELKPGDDIVLVACWSAHRGEAFDACRDAMERLKQQAPFWKRETTAQGDRWVHNATEDSQQES